MEQESDPPHPDLLSSSQSDKSDDIVQTGWIPFVKRDHIPYWQLIMFSGSIMSYQFTYSVLSAISTPLMNNVLYLPNWLTQIVWIIGPLVGIFWQPFVGYWSDGTHFKMGRRRPFILIGTTGSVIAFGLLFIVVYIKTIPLNAKRAVFVVALIVAHVFINMMQGPARFIIGDIIPNHMQIRANSVGALMIAGSAIILNLFGGFRIAQTINGINDMEFTIIIGMIFMFLGMIMTCLSAKEEQFLDYTKRANPFKQLCGSIHLIPKPVIFAAFAIMLSWAAYWPWYVNCTAFFGHDIYRELEQTYETRDEAEDAGISFGMLVIALQNFVAVLYSLVQDYVVKCIGLKWSYMGAQLLEAAVLLPTYWINNKWILMVLFALLGVSYTAFQTIPFSLVGMLITEDLMGTTMGALSIFIGIGQQIGALVICSGIGSKFGHSYREILSISSAFATLAAIFAAFIPDHSSNREQDLSQEEKLEDVIPDDEEL